MLGHDTTRSSCLRAARSVDERCSASLTRSSSACSSSSGVRPFTLFARGFLAVCVSCLRPPQPVRQSRMLAFADDAALARLVIAAAQRRACLPPRQAFRSLGRGHARAGSTVRGGLISLGHQPSPLPPLHAPAPPSPRPPARPPPRALELLASCNDGCTEAILRAHGFSTAQMVDLCALGS
jgi:hypothetical protein